MLACTGRPRHSGAGGPSPPTLPALPPEAGNHGRGEIGMALALGFRGGGGEWSRPGSTRPRISRARGRRRCAACQQPLAPRPRHSSQRRPRGRASPAAANHAPQEGRQEGREEEGGEADRGQGQRRRASWPRCELALAPVGSTGSRFAQWLGCRRAQWPIAAQRRGGTQSPPRRPAAPRRRRSRRAVEGSPALRARGGRPASAPSAPSRPAVCVALA